MKTILEFLQKQHTQNSKEYEIYLGINTHSKTKRMYVYVSSLEDAKELINASNYTKKEKEYSIDFISTQKFPIMILPKKPYKDDPICFGYNPVNSASTEYKYKDTITCDEFTLQNWRKNGWLKTNILYI